MSESSPMVGFTTCRKVSESPTGLDVLISETVETFQMLRHQIQMRGGCAFYRCFYHFTRRRNSKIILALFAALERGVCRQPRRRSVCNPCCQCLSKALRWARRCSGRGKGFALARRYHPHPSPTRFRCRRGYHAGGFVEFVACPKPACRSMAKEANDVA